MIYYLDEDPQKCAQMLADDDLKKQIEAIAQTLCNVHIDLYDKQRSLKTKPLLCHEIAPLNYNHRLKPYSNWASECLANYKKLVDMGLACTNEKAERFGVKVTTEDPKAFLKHITEITYEIDKIDKIIEWARDNVPDLPKYQHTKIAENNGVSWLYNEEQTTPFPLVMPGEIIEEAKITNPERWGHVSNVVYAYRKYYFTKLPKDANWTRREQPSFL
jgi:hypothetical protein